mmetsp:Transcript_13884/g.20493  ORF Transcript_13884/g.20493 Transcript_13884/m.20493 type:complete len:85 (+) Transcript_13884:548-802(+)
MPLPSSGCRRLLFSNLPVPSNVLYLGAILLQPVKIKDDHMLESFKALEEMYTNCLKMLVSENFFLIKKMLRKKVRQQQPRANLA